jgi:hypothetical protein
MAVAGSEWIAVDTLCGVGAAPPELADYRFSTDDQVDYGAWFPMRFTKTLFSMFDSVSAQAKASP